MFGPYTNRPNFVFTMGTNQHDTQMFFADVGTNSSPTLSLIITQKLQRYMASLWGSFSWVGKYSGLIPESWREFLCMEKITESLGEMGCVMLGVEIGTVEPELLVEGSSAGWLLLEGGLLSIFVLGRSQKHLQVDSTNQRF